MTLSVAVQNHPDRAGLLPPLLEALVPARVDVVVDPEPLAGASPWRTYRRALEETPSWASHRVIVQDDARVCASFPVVLERAVAARPDRLLALCVCGRPARSARRVLRAGERGDSWAVLDTGLWIPTVALVWPSRLIAPTLAYVDGQTWPREFRADDEIVGRAMRGLREQALATVPSIVQHDDLVPSLVGKRAAKGRDRGRVAVCFIPDECDPLEIDWTVGPVA